MAANPAGLGLVDSRSIELSLTAAFANGQFVNSANPDARLDAKGLMPFGAFGSRLGRSRISIGLAAIPEMASAAKWNFNDAPGGVGNVSYGPMNHTSEIVSIRTSAGVGAYFGPRLQIGATFGSVYNRNKLQSAYIFQTHPALAGLKTRLDLRTNGVGWNGSVGVLTKLSKRVRVGAAYKSAAAVISRGTAEGNAGIQFAAIGLGAARPDFRYDAQVDNVLPQSALAHGSWQVDSKLKLVAQMDWVNWKRAFTTLPVNLTQGNNADINGLLGTNTLNDAVPLKWRDQYTLRAGLERSWRESATVRAGYAHASNPVPMSTLSPLTAAITRNTVAAGLGYRWKRSNFDVAYTMDPAAKATVTRSILRSGEFNDSRLSVGTHMLVLSTSTSF